MKKIIQSVLVLLLFITTANAQIIRPFTPRYSNPSVKGNIVYVSNSIISASGVGPGNPGTGEVPPGGNSRDNSGNGINIDIDNPAPAVKLAFSSTWNYHTQAAAPVNSPAATDWRQPAYVMPAAWNVGAIAVNGPGKYGYNSGQTTCLKSSAAATSCTPGGGAKYTAYYFRNTVNFTALELSTTFNNIQLNLLRNDGIVVYVNGVERIRDNMPGGAVVFGTLASADIAPGAAEAVTYNLSPAFFVAGANTIAVEVHLRQTTSNNMSFDMQILGLGINGTFNSSSADLNLPSCSQVLFAGLYWGADQGSNGTDSTWRTAAYNTIKLRIPGAAAYTTLTSTQNDTHSNSNSPGLGHVGYLCFRDITSLLNSTNPNGTYTAADVVGPIGINNSCGGWTIVIAYSNSTLQPRNLTVFDGSVIVNAGDPPADVNINGFLTPPSPAAVSCELGAVVYDGDRGSSDAFAFRQFGAVPFYDMATVAVPLNGAADAWNSKISYKGAVVATRNPAFQNTLGYDAPIFDLPNTANAQLGNNQTAATVRFSSTSENYFVHVLTTSISQYNPTFNFNKSATDLNGGTLAPGDIMRYQVNFSNVGNDASTNTVILDNIPAGTSYVPGSLRISGIAKTDAAGDDQAEYDAVNNRVVYRVGTGANAVNGGNISASGAGNVVFDVVAASSCTVLACVGTIVNKASMTYRGFTTGVSLVDTSGVDVSGCIIAPLAVTFTPVGSCFTPADTLVINACPVLSAFVPIRSYGGYTIYSAMPFIPANIYNTTIPVSTSRVFWAYFNNGPGCSDTVRINMIFTACPDIDDDNDGIPDYVEFNDVRATQDADGDLVPNWNDNSYPGYVDNNSDKVNDNFDWGADADNDGIINFRDLTFWIAWVDVNGDGINDMADRDLDGLPNQYDLDSDDDGIPDTVESYGVDTNGDGRIDNYTDTDFDGFSQNVDLNNTGVTGSFSGLGAQDLDGDLIPNYLDADSDNDGIPDIVEAGGIDTDNDGKVASFLDTDGDGYYDPVDGDVGNDLVAENAVNTLLRTGGDLGPIDGRADSYPFRNMDNDRRSNPYDLDSDGDGIVDVLEAGFIDANFNGFIDGALGTDGWNAAVNALGTLTLNNTDGRGNPDYMDIDSDDDGIPDNVEGQTTAGYKFPLYTDADNDGIDGNYDAVVGFGGSGIFLSDKDGDNLPDYRDLDTDADGAPDIIEGNDFNLNGIADDNVTLTLLDTDGDGLDNRFDSLNSTINIKGTSYRMGTGGSLIGDPAPGTRSPVQRKLALQPDRDWRYVGIVLEVQLLEFTGTSQINNVVLNWGIITPVNISRFEIERSTDNMVFAKVAAVDGNISLHELHNFSANDNISSLNSQVIYYRLKIIAANGLVKFSNVIVVRKSVNKTLITIQPNPASNNTAIHFYAEKESEVIIRLIDAVGKSILQQKQKAVRGNNILQLNDLSKYTNGVYSLQIMVNGELITQKLIIRNK